MSFLSNFELAHLKKQFEAISDAIIDIGECNKCLDITKLELVTIIMYHIV